MSEVKIIYRQVWCGVLGSYADCPIIYGNEVAEIEDLMCEHGMLPFCRDSQSSVRFVVEVMKIDEFKAMTDCDPWHRFGFLEANEYERPCDYIEVDGMEVFGRREDFKPSLELCE